jgi:hypothetical protein
MAIDNGGPAFPQMTDMGHSFTGMTLRDYFAAKSLVALLAEPEWQGVTNCASALILGDCPSESLAERYAIAAFRLADAMLAERAK